MRLISGCFEKKTLSAGIKSFELGTPIFIRGAGFLFDNNTRMGRHNVLVIKRNMEDDQSLQESCLYSIIGIRITPFLDGGL